MIETTLRKLRKYKACDSKYYYLAAALGDEYGDNTLLPVSRILDINGVSDALWALRACDMSQEDESAVYLLACDYAEHALHIFEDNHPDNPYPRAAIEARRAWVRREISDEELKCAADAAANTAFAPGFYADAFAVAYIPVSFAAFAAAHSAFAVASNAASAVARSAALAAARSAYHTTFAATIAAEEEWQAQKLKEIL